MEYKVLSGPFNAGELERVLNGHAAEDPPPMWKALLPLVRLFLKTPEQGAATSIYPASSPQAEGMLSKRRAC